MRVTNSKIIYLTEKEVKEAIMDWVFSRHNEEYHNILMQNNFALDFHNNCLALVVDGEVEEYNLEKK
jgi:hypothetical protein